MTIDDLTGRVNAVFARVNAVPAARLNRVVGLTLGAPSVGVLAIAAWLTPSSSGYGTHTQLGLGSCTMLTLTGWPCPMCGMTTTFSLMAHGRMVDAVVNQPFGVVLFTLTLLAAGLGILDLVTAKGRWRATLAWIQRYEQKVAILLLVGLAGGWIYKCVRMHPEMLGG